MAGKGKEVRSRSMTSNVARREKHTGSESGSTGGREVERWA